MARINIEDKFYKDARFLKLLRLVDGDQYRAIGICVCAWNLGQEWFLESESGLIPMGAWDAAEIPEAFVEAKLAARTDGGVVIADSDEHFGWLRQCSQGGKKAREASRLLKVPSTQLNNDQALAPSLAPSLDPAKKEKSKKKKTSLAALHSELAQYFESIYERYPLKKGRERGFKIMARELTKPEHLDELVQAIENYRDQLAREGTESKYILHFSTFMGRWRDWLDPNYGKVDLPKNRSNEPDWAN